MKKFFLSALILLLIAFMAQAQTVVTLVDEDEDFDQTEIHISQTQSENNSKISEKMAELKRREKALAEREAKYKADQEAAELAALEADIAKREAEMAAKEAEAEKAKNSKKSAELSEREQEFSQREADLKRREAALRDEEQRKAQENADRLAELERKEQELKEKEKQRELEAREAEIARREEALRIKEEQGNKQTITIEDSVPSKPVAPVAPVVPAEDVPASNSSSYAVITQTESGLMNWTEDYLQATGMAVAPPRARGAQGRALARRGATLDLQRNLLEALKGVQVDAETRMEDFLAEDTVMSRVSGVIKGVEVINGEWDGEAYTVTGRVRMQPIRSSVMEKIPAANKKAPAAPKGSGSGSGSKSAGRFTGLVIDVRHLPLIPSMSFRVLDESGREVYSMSFVNHDRYLQSGLCTYYNNINFAKGELSVAGNPIVTKAIRLTNGGVDIVISNSQAAKVRGSSYDFRKDCKVIIVKS